MERSLQSLDKRLRAQAHYREAPENSFERRFPVYQAPSPEEAREARDLLRSKNEKGPEETIRLQRRRAKLYLKILVASW